MVIYRSREFGFHNLWALVAVAITVAVVVPVLVVTEAWAHAPLWSLLGLVVLLIPLGAPMTITVERPTDGEATTALPAVHINFAGLGKREIPLADVADVERRDYRPIREFGGWGWRWSWSKHAVAYTTRGSSAVVLTLNDGQQVYLGVADELTLVELLRYQQK